MKEINKIHKNRPKSEEDFEKLFGDRLIELDSGCFRIAYRIPKTQLVVKIPIEQTGISHTRREIRRIKEVLRKKSLRHVRRYAPKIYYSDYKNGIIILPILKIGGVNSHSELVIQQIFKDTFPCIGGHSDAHYTNLGYDNRGQIKLIDWGCV